MSFPPCGAPPERARGEGAERMPRNGTPADGLLSAPDRDFLFGLQVQALHYFLDNQAADGLVLDRQRNHGALRSGGVCSLAATGMGCIALALAAEAEYQLLAVHRRRANQRTPPHLPERPPGRSRRAGRISSTPRREPSLGDDACSTVETAVARRGRPVGRGGMLRDTAELQDLANRLYASIDWSYWSVARRSDPARCKDDRGRFLKCSWDRLNGETAFMYALAAGADEGRCLPEGGWNALQPFRGEVAGLRFASADLGLFVFQYGLDLLDLRAWERPARSICSVGRSSPSPLRPTLRLPIGRGPLLDLPPLLGTGPRVTAPPRRPAGTSIAITPRLAPSTAPLHLTATLASATHRPGEVLDNLRAADPDGRLGARGPLRLQQRFNLDAGWARRRHGRDRRRGLRSLPSTTCSVAIVSATSSTACPASTGPFRGSASGRGRTFARRRKSSHKKSILLRTSRNLSAHACAFQLPFDRAICTVRTLLSAADPAFLQCRSRIKKHRAWSRALHCWARPLQ